METDLQTLFDSFNNFMWVYSSNITHFTKKPIFQNREDIRSIRWQMIYIYAWLVMATTAAAIGASIHMFTDVMNDGYLSDIGALIFLILLSETPEDSQSVMICLVYLMGFSTMMGMGMGPLLKHAILDDPSIILTAVTGTMFIIALLPVCVFMSERTWDWV